MPRCSRCGRNSHVVSQCFARTHLHGDALLSTSEESADSSDAEQDKRQRTVRDAPKRTKKDKKRSRVTADDSISRAGVYVLQYTEGSKQADTTMYYVGKSQDVKERIKQHMKGTGAACLEGSTHLQEIAPFTRGDPDDLEAWERTETLERMRHFGIERVRGWMFTSKNLSMDQGREAFRQICERFDLCRKCGRNSHFAEHCFARSAMCWASCYVSL